MARRSSIARRPESYSVTRPVAVTYNNDRWRMELNDESPTGAGRYHSNGPVAIPKLRKLLRNQDRQTRHYAVYCLASIGGPSARRAIETAVSTDSHPCVKRFMLVSIQTIDVKHGGVKADSEEWA